MAAPLQGLARSVAANPCACSGVGANFTCMTCLLTATTIDRVYDNNVRSQPERVI
jgi:hypothetical protein